MLTALALLEVLLRDRLRASEAALAATGRSSLERTEETEAAMGVDAN